MRKLAIILTVLFVSFDAFGQAALKPVGPPPSLDEVRREMGIPSSKDVRGQKDSVGFASTAEQMAKVWDLSATLPLPEVLGPSPGPGVVGAICPHDDYIYAGRVYRQVLPLVTAKQVILVGVFHRYRRFNVRDKLVFDTYRAWRSPDGEIAVSSLRDELISKLPASDYVRDAAMHDSEHSLEAIAYWLKHARPDVEIVPIIIPAASFSRFEELALRLGQALAGAMKSRGWILGKDVSIVISSDGTHYGRDFNYEPYGEGGVNAYAKAVKRDREILKGPLAGTVSSKKARKFFEACVNPENPDEYRMPWCGRFSIPFGLLFLNETAKELGLKTVKGWPLAFGTTVGGPTLGQDLGIGATAPSNLYHFVTFPGEVYTVTK